MNFYFVFQVFAIVAFINFFLFFPTGEKWKQMPLESRRPYTEGAERLRVAHMIRYPNYKYRPRRRKPQIKKVNGTNANQSNNTNNNNPSTKNNNNQVNGNSCRVGPNSTKSSSGGNNGSAKTVTTSSPKSQSTITTTTTINQVLVVKKEETIRMESQPSLLEATLTAQVATPLNSNHVAATPDSMCPKILSLHTPDHSPTCSPQPGWPPPVLAMTVPSLTPTSLGALPTPPEASPHELEQHSELHHNPNQPLDHSHHQLYLQHQMQQQQQQLPPQQHIIHQHQMQLESIQRQNIQQQQIHQHHINQQQTQFQHQLQHQQQQQQQQQYMLQQQITSDDRGLGSKPCMMPPGSDSPQSYSAFSHYQQNYYPGMGAEYQEYQGSQQDSYYPNLPPYEGQTYPNSPSCYSQNMQPFVHTNGESSSIQSSNTLSLNRPYLFCYAYVSHFGFNTL